MSQRVRVDWVGAQRFTAGRPGGPTILIDGDAKEAPSPVDVLLSALASCVSVDVVEILQKRRTPVRALRVEVDAERAETMPSYVKGVGLSFVIDGEGIDRVHAERAIDLSITKYCSVRDSLRDDVVITWALTLNGDPSVAVRAAGI